MTLLRNYFESGEWKTEYADLSDSDLDGCLEIPEFALRPIWNGKDFTKPLIETFGCSSAKFLKLGRLGLDRLLQSAQSSGRLTSYEAACARLVFESVAQPRQPFPEGDPTTRAQWIRGFAAKDFGPIKGMNPARVLRLATIRDWQLKTDPEVKKAVAESVIGALAQLKPGEPHSQDFQIRMVLIRHHMLNIECDDSEPDAREWMTRAGVEPARINELVGLIRDESPVDPLFAVSGQANLRMLLDRPEFKEAAAFYGFTFDADGYSVDLKLTRLLSELSDPWCKSLVRRSLEPQGRAVRARARARIEQLADGVGKRPEVMKSLIGAEILLPRETKDIIASELSPHGEHLHQRVFQALAGVRFDSSDSAFRQMLQETGLASWFEPAFDAYCASVSGASVPKWPHELERNLVSAGRAAARFPAIANFAEELERAGSDFEVERHREEAERAGRGWFFDYAERCVDLAQSQYDRGSGIFQDTDRELVLQALQRRRSKSAEWWKLPMDPATELRVCEVSVHHFGNIQYQGHLAALAKGVGDRIYQSIPAALRGRAQKKIEACANFVAYRNGAEGEQILQAFRSGSAADFVHSLEGDQIDLPPAERLAPRVVGRRVLVFGAIVALLPLLLLVRVLFASPGKQERPTPVGETPPVGLSLDLSDGGWIRLSSGKGGYALRIGAKQFRECFGANPGGKEVDSIPMVTQSLAKQFVPRFEVSLRRRYSLGARLPSAGEQPIAWDSLELGIPTADDLAGLAPSTGLDVVSIWLEGGVRSGAVNSDRLEAENPFNLGQLYVVIRRR